MRSRRSHWTESTSTSQRLALVALVLASACSGSEPDKLDTALFDAGLPLGEVQALAHTLEGLSGGAGAPRECAAVADQLDKLGNPEQLAQMTEKVQDLKVAEAALDQQAAISSVMAACRGEAPVSLKTATAELAVTDAALTSLLKEIN